MTNTAALSAKAQQQADREQDDRQRVHERAQQPGRHARDSCREQQQSTEGDGHPRTLRDRLPSVTCYSSTAPRRSPAPARCPAGRSSARRSPGPAARPPRPASRTSVISRPISSCRSSSASRSAATRCWLASSSPRTATFCALQQVLDPAPALRVAEDPADHVGVGEAAVLDCGVGHQGVAHAGGADHLGRDVGRVEQVAAGPVETSPKKSSSATWPPIAIWIRLVISARDRV